MGPVTVPPSGKWCKIDRSQHAKYTCSFCGKTQMKTSCGHLALWLLHENSSQGCLDQQHFCHHSKVTKGAERPVEAPPFKTPLAYNKQVKWWSATKYRLQVKSCTEITGKSLRRNKILHSLKVGPKILFFFCTPREENSHVQLEKLFYFILKLFQNKKGGK